MIKSTPDLDMKIFRAAKDAESKEGRWYHRYFPTGPVNCVTFVRSVLRQAGLDLPSKGWYPSQLRKDLRGTTFSNNLRSLARWTNITGLPLY